MRWFLAMLAIVGIGIGAAGYYYWSVMPSSAVSRALAEEVHRGPNRNVDFAEVAPFAWDRVFIFHPYTPKEHIEKCLGFSWPGLSWTEIESSDGVNLVVFVREGAVVCWFEHSRRDGDFFGLADPPEYRREEAKFRVSQWQDQHLMLTR